MTRFESWSLVNGALAAIATLAAVIEAIWGERIRQRWTRPQLELSLFNSEGELNTRQDKKKARYYSLVVRNKRPSSPASNVRVMLMSIDKEGPDGNWRPVRFSGPVQVMWRWPKVTPAYTTAGPDETATYAFLVEGETKIGYQLYWYPNNLDPSIPPHEPTRLAFRAVSDSASSDLLIVDIAWDGEWHEDSDEMAKHLIACRNGS